MLISSHSSDPISPTADAAAPQDRSRPGGAAQGKARPRRIGLVVVHGVGRQKPGETVGLLGRALADSSGAGSLSGGLMGRRLSADHHDPGSEMQVTLALRAHAAAGEIRVRLYEVYWADVTTPPGRGGAVRYRLWLLWTLVFPIANLILRRYRARPLPLVTFIASWAALAAGGIAAHVSDLALHLGLRLSGLWRLSRRIERAVLDYAGDVRLYARPPVRDALLGRFAAALARAASENDEVQVLGHSLGSVIAFDALTSGILRPADVARLTHLHTWGSPLDKFYFVWPQLLGRQARPTPPRTVRWINWNHRRDPVGGRLDFFAGIDGIHPPDNRSVGGGLSLAAAHIDYWTRAEVVGSLLESLGLPGGGGAGERGGLS
jgi:hypothetical protein